MPAPPASSPTSAVRDAANEQLVRVEDAGVVRLLEQELV